MLSDHAPYTLVREVKIPLRETLQFTVQDTLQTVIQKQLYQCNADIPVTIFDEEEVIGITTAGELRGRFLPRTWTGKLGDNIRRMSLPAVITNNTRVAHLLYLVQLDHPIDWMLVIDDDSGVPNGILNRQIVLQYMPPLSKPGEVYRDPDTRLWGDPDISPVAYYCKVENRYFGPNSIKFDAQGNPRDSKGHPVQRLAPKP